MTLTEVLPGSKTSLNRAMQWTPVCAGVGTLELADKKGGMRYAVAVQPFGGVRMSKADGETYVATRTACECKGFTYGRGLACKHIEAVRALVANDWLAADGLETITDTAAEIEAKDAHYAAAGI